MADPLRPVPIQELTSLEQGLHWQVNQMVDGLESIEPVVGQLHASLQGPVIAVSGEARTAVTLCCDRCLRPFAHALAFKAEERIGLGGSADDIAEALEFDAEGMAEQLDPQGSFDPERWIYEQLTLQLPVVNRCGSSCPGPLSWGHGETITDPRWAGLKRLQP